MQRADSALRHSESFGVRRTESSGMRRTENSEVAMTDSSKFGRVGSSGLLRRQSLRRESISARRTESSSAKKGMFAPNQYMTISSQRSATKLSTMGGARGSFALNRGSSVLDSTARNTTSRSRKQAVSRFRQVLQSEPESVVNSDLSGLDPVLSSVLSTAQQFNDVVRTVLAVSRKTLKEIRQVTHALEHGNLGVSDIVQAEKFIHRSFNGEIQRLTERKSFADESLRRCRAMLTTEIEDPKIEEIVSASCSVELRNARRVLMATDKIAQSLALVRKLAQEKVSPTTIEKMQAVPEWVHSLKKTADHEITRMLAGQRNIMARRQSSAKLIPEPTPEQTHEQPEPSPPTNLSQFLADSLPRFPDSTRQQTDNLPRFPDPTGQKTVQPARWPQSGPLSLSQAGDAARPSAPIQAPVVDHFPSARENPVLVQKVVPAVDSFLEFRTNVGPRRETTPKAMTPSLELQSQRPQVQRNASPNQRQVPAKTTPEPNNIHKVSSWGDGGDEQWVELERSRLASAEAAERFLSEEGYVGVEESVPEPEPEPEPKPKPEPKKDPELEEWEKAVLLLGAATPDVDLLKSVAHAARGSGGSLAILLANVLEPLSPELKRPQPQDLKEMFPTPTPSSHAPTKPPSPPPLMKMPDPKQKTQRWASSAWAPETRRWGRNQWRGEVTQGEIHGATMRFPLATIARVYPPTTAEQRQRPPQYTGESGPRKGLFQRDSKFVVPAGGMMKRKALVSSGILGGSFEQARSSIYHPPPQHPRSHSVPLEERPRAGRESSLGRIAAEVGVDLSYLQRLRVQTSLQSPLGVPSPLLPDISFACTSRSRAPTSQRLMRECQSLSLANGLRIPTGLSYLSPDAVRERETLLQQKHGLAAHPRFPPFISDHGPASLSSPFPVSWSLARTPPSRGILGQHTPGTLGQHTPTIEMRSGGSGMIEMWEEEEDMAIISRDEEEQYWAEEQAAEEGQQLESTEWEEKEVENVDVQLTAPGEEDGMGNSDESVEVEDSRMEVEEERTPTSAMMSPTPAMITAGVDQLARQTSQFWEMGGHSIGARAQQERADTYSACSPVSHAESPTTASTHDPASSLGNSSPDSSMDPSSRGTTRSSSHKSSQLLSPASKQRQFSTNSMAASAGAASPAWSLTGTDAAKDRKTGGLGLWQEHATPLLATSSNGSGSGSLRASAIKKGMHSGNKSLPRRMLGREVGKRDNSAPSLIGPRQGSVDLEGQGVEATDALELSGWESPALTDECSLSSAVPDTVS